MLLEEALSSSSGASTDGKSAPSLPPADGALALLSFLRDELPAGGSSAEKRFLRLFSLIVDRVFGELNRPQLQPGNNNNNNNNSSTSPGSITSPGGSTYSSPTSTDTNTSGGGKLYHHKDGGWLTLINTPKPTGTSSTSTASPSTSSLTSTQQKQAQSLENDPIFKLLRAPINNNNNNDLYSQQQPTLLNAISAESIHHPQIKFKLPLGTLSSLFKDLIQDWKKCYLQEMERANQNTAMGRTAARGPFASSTTTAATTTNANNPIKGMSGKENGTRILYDLLLNGPNEQAEMKKHFQSGGDGNVLQQQSINQLSSPRAAFITPMKQQQQQSQSQRTTPRTSSNSTIHNKNSEANLDLTMLEYYLVVFLRFPLANQEWENQYQDQLRRMRYGTATTPYGQRVHSHLMSSYMNYYLPHGEYQKPDGSSPQRDGMIADVSTSPWLDRSAELFLRLVIEFWVEGQVSPPTFAEGIQRYRNGRSAFLSTSSSSSSSSSLNPTLQDSLELSQPLKDYVSPPSQIQIGVENLVRHLVSDVSVRNMVKPASVAIQRRQIDEREGRATIDDNAKISWCLPPAMTTTQSSILNYIRLGLTCGSIHDPRSVFHNALEAWLVWIEPWNYVMKRRKVVVNSGGKNSASSATHRAGEFLRNAAATVSPHRGEYYLADVTPKPTSASTYSSQWEAYIVSNLNLYTVPLAIFLKRARELDFSSTKEYPRSLALVQRVLRVYSKQVVSVLNTVLNRRADTLSTSLATMHRDNLKAFCPPSSWKLTECQLDATNLLEEVFSQHQKRKNEMDFVDRMEAKVNAFFSGKIGSDEAALQTLLSQVRYIMHLPQDYQVLPEEPHSSRGWFRFLGFGNRKDGDGSLLAKNLLFPERDASGKLTDEGRAQINSGTRKCNPIDVHFVGDPLLARVRSYEFPLLVEWSVQLSNYLNRKLGFVSEEVSGSDGQNTDVDLLSKHLLYPKDSFRINLRFLADQRNFIYIIFAYVLWRIIL